jgi:hypothetical protein
MVESGLTARTVVDSVREVIRQAHRSGRIIPEASDSGRPGWSVGKNFACRDVPSNQCASVAKYRRHASLTNRHRSLGMETRLRYLSERRLQRNRAGAADIVRCGRAATQRILGMQPGPCVLVGHSYGGSILTEAGNDRHVAALGYVAARMPDAGESEGQESRRPRPELGHLQIDIAVEDTGAFTKPHSFQRIYNLMENTDLLEYVCNELNVDKDHLVGKQQPRIARMSAPKAPSEIRPRWPSRSDQQFRLDGSHRSRLAS